MHLIFYLMVTIYVWNVGFSMRLNRLTQSALEPSVWVWAVLNTASAGSHEEFLLLCPVGKRRNLTLRVFYWPLDFEQMGSKKQWNILPFLEVFCCEMLWYLFCEPCLLSCEFFLNASPDPLFLPLIFKTLCFRCFCCRRVIWLFFFEEKWWCEVNLPQTLHISTLTFKKTTTKKKPSFNFKSSLEGERVSSPLNEPQMWESCLTWFQKLPLVFKYWSKLLEGPWFCAFEILNFILTVA